jgi:hypothetical protein
LQAQSEPNHPGARETRRMALAPGLRRDRVEV